MQVPIYDAAPTPAIYIIAMLVAVFVIVLMLIIKRPKSGSTLSVTLYIILALLIGIAMGWGGRVYSEHYKYTHQPPYVDCPNC